MEAENATNKKIVEYWDRVKIMKSCTPRETAREIGTLESAGVIILGELNIGVATEGKKTMSSVIDFTEGVEGDLDLDNIWKCMEK